MKDFEFNCLETELASSIRFCYIIWIDLEFGLNRLET